MSTAQPIDDPVVGDGGDGGTYPPVTPTAPDPAFGPVPTPAPAPTPPAPPASPAPTGRTSSVAPITTTDVNSYLIPLSPIPSQVLAVTLGNQSCTFKVYTRSTGLFLDLYVSDTPICTGVLCLDRNAIVRAAYLGFVGELTFIDTQGYDDPSYQRLGSRFNLVWLDY